MIVAGINRIVPSLGDDAMRRVREYGYPLEGVRAVRAYGIPSRIGRCVILAFEGVEGRIAIILVGDRLGY